MHMQRMRSAPYQEILGTGETGAREDSSSFVLLIAHQEMSGHKSAGTVRTVSTCRTHSIASEWDLVCGRSWMLQLVNSGFFLGSLAGMFLFQQVAEELGAWLPLPHCWHEEYRPMCPVKLNWVVSWPVWHLSLSFACILVMQHMFACKR